MVGIGDSLNPATILAALYLASRDRPRAHVLAFTLAVLVVYVAGGLAIVLGPGQLALAAIPHPSPQACHIIEIAVGLGMLSAAALLSLNGDGSQNTAGRQPARECGRARSSGRR